MIVFDDYSENIQEKQGGTAFFAGKSAVF